ncbi:MAG TPA: type II toxin-antitoxin system HicB family antitoxin [Thermodesulfobacteriota bacterium]|nr:type II toxin-antitoxin system HicB family antitoxin [Thermodesulfobacteriota bacterium]
MKHSMLLNKVGNNYELYITDLSGFVAAGKTKEEILDIIREAMEIHLESIDEKGISTSDSRSNLD